MPRKPISCPRTISSRSSPSRVSPVTCCVVIRLRSRVGHDPAERPALGRHGRRCAHSGPPARRRVPIAGRARGAPSGDRHRPARDYRRMTGVRQGSNCPVRTPPESSSLLVSADRPGGGAAGRRRAPPRPGPARPRARRPGRRCPPYASQVPWSNWYLPRYWPLADTAWGFPPDSHWAMRARCEATSPDGAGPLWRRAPGRRRGGAAPPCADGAEGRRRGGGRGRRGGGGGRVVGAAQQGALGAGVGGRGRAAAHRALHPLPGSGERLAAVGDRASRAPASAPATPPPRRRPRPGRPPAPRAAAPRRAFAVRRPSITAASLRPTDSSARWALTASVMLPDVRMISASVGGSSR